MAHRDKNLRVSTWEKSIILRKRHGWKTTDLVDFLNRKGVAPKPLTAGKYASWEEGTAKAPKELMERVDDLLTLELYRTQ